MVVACLLCLFADCQYGRKNRSIGLSVDNTAAFMPNRAKRRKKHASRARDEQRILCRTLLGVASFLAFVRVWRIGRFLAIGMWLESEKSSVPENANVPLLFQQVFSKHEWHNEAEN